MFRSEFDKSISSLETERLLLLLLKPGRSLPQTAGRIRPLKYHLVNLELSQAPLRFEGRFRLQSHQWVGNLSVLS